MGKRICMAVIFYVSTAITAVAQTQLTPVMGWSSWNNFRADISESIIHAQADAMVNSGMKDAGYSYINIDDGYFGGRDSSGNILFNSKKFPQGMEALAKYIHTKKLKAGIYSDAGINTCASYWDKDTIGSGMGLFGHEQQDISRLLQQWDFDFLKVDWCGGESMQLDEEVRYSYISKIIRQTKPGAVFNVCRWKFPGKWVCNVADSWRISGDINNTFESILKIIDQNADLWPYAGPGHVNDMDMLQVGRGMSVEEDKAHFSMWCMMSSPLLAGNDLTKMSEQTRSILTNKEMIAIDQDPLVYQARRVIDYGDLEVWAKPLGSTMSGKVAVALLNRSPDKAIIKLDLDSAGIDAQKAYTMRDVWNKKAYASSKNPVQSILVPPHAVVVLVLNGSAKPYNVFQKK
ncbi:MAG: glycoside hydrolase family 27 protein [Bacteroidetes bacterium]|nr:glycoside hydrolase family 27 protein [Bacteroidota bacterium]